MLQRVIRLRPLLWRHLETSSYAYGAACDDFDWIGPINQSIDRLDGMLVVQKSCKSLSSPCKCGQCPFRHLIIPLFSCQSYFLCDPLFLPLFFDFSAAENFPYTFFIHSPSTKYFPTPWRPPSLSSSSHWLSSPFSAVPAMAPSSSTPTIPRRTT